ncbi:PIN domain-containing protein [Caloranaerobacter azorensis]|uniref:PIN domain-containing protein n=1 Tax=Caloranaerobacter azorensis TaxID=116090 RepID=A0A6P1YEB7_9FIRM|nr:PIN domain-containing protein [Caloranaerobacter azorensis]QIB27571.1 PIN domain-containing protein [Caloranaerobacter azorensis]
MNGSTIYSIRSGNTNIIYPDIIYLDTSFIYTVYGDENANYKRSCDDFFINCVLSKTILTYSGVVLDELKHLIQVNIYDKEAEKRGITDEHNSNGVIIKRWKKLFDIEPGIMVDVMKEYNRVREILDNNMILLEYKDDEKFRKLVDYIGLNFGQDSIDAKHIAVALINGINSIATLDEHFVRTDGMNIYGPTKGIIKHIDKRNNVYQEFDNIVISNILDSVYK